MISEILSIGWKQKIIKIAPHLKMTKESLCARLKKIKMIDENTIINYDQTKVINYNVLTTHLE